jgi:hypothetical protein
MENKKLLQIRQTNFKKLNELTNEQKFQFQKAYEKQSINYSYENRNCGIRN